MRTIVVAFGVVLALAFQATSAVAQAGDTVTGSGTTDLGSSFDFSVEGSATGGNPAGHFSLTRPPESPNIYAWEATPRCMNVAGDRATLGFFIDSGSIGGSDVSGQGVLLWVQHHPADHGIVYYKLLGPDVPGDPQPITCADPRPGPGPNFTAIGFGGFMNVTDSQPPIPRGSDSVSGSADSGCLFFDPSGFCIFRLLPGPAEALEAVGLSE